MKAFFSWGIATSLLLGLGVAYAQVRHTAHLDDTGKMISAEQHVHAKPGHVVTWARKTGAAKSWYVKFTDKSPCSNGSEFGSDRAKVCNIVAVCKIANDASCIFPYQSATAPGAAMNDPDVIVDP
jgi:hypothetical protein